MGRLQGKTAVVAGAADGIGHAIAEGFAREGSQVFLSDINDRRGRAFAKALRDTGAKAEYVHCDVAEEKDIANLIKPAVKRGGGLDILVNNAAIDMGGMPVYEMTEAEWQRLI